MDTAPSSHPSDRTLRSFGLGKLDLRYLTLHLSVTAFMLYLTIKVLESRRWR